MKEATRYLKRRRERDGRTTTTDGLIGLHLPPGVDMDALAAALRQATAGKASMTAAELDAIARDVVTRFGGEVGQTAQPGKLPEPWRTYLTAEVHMAYVAGHLGEQPFIGTNTWMLYCPEEIVEQALALGFTHKDMPAGALGEPTGDPYVIGDLPEPTETEDGALVAVGVAYVQRHILAPLVLQGATVGYSGPTQTDPIHCPGIGIAMPMAIGRPAVLDA